MKRILIMSIGSLLIACSSGQAPVQDNVIDRPPTKVENWIAEENLRFEGSWVLPLRGSQINILDVDNYLTIQGDSVFAKLPFYGQQNLGGGYGLNSIRIASEIKNYEASRNKKDTGTLLNFSASGEQSENFRISMTVYDNQNATVTVRSGIRDAMQYEGIVKQVKNEK